VSLTLYDFPTSGNARKVRLLLAELGLDYEHVLVPRARPRPDWYLEVNPFGVVIWCLQNRLDSVGGYR
jgi:glutathione S-transferase